MDTPSAARLPHQSVVTTELDLVLVMSEDRTAPVSCRLTYDASAPYEISADFETADGPVTWVFARDLLREGLARPAGDGDVVVWPSRGRDGELLCLVLSSPSGRALLEAPRWTMSTFLYRTDLAVPPGTESGLLDLDDLVEHLLDA